MGIGNNFSDIAPLFNRKEFLVACCGVSDKIVIPVQTGI